MACRRLGASKSSLLMGARRRGDVHVHVYIKREREGGFHEFRFGGFLRPKSNNSFPLCLPSPLCASVIPATTHPARMSLIWRLAAKKSLKPTDFPQTFEKCGWEGMRPRKEQQKMGAFIWELFGKRETRGQGAAVCIHRVLVVPGQETHLLRVCINEGTSVL